MNSVLVAARMRFLAAELIREAARTHNPLTARRLRSQATTLRYRLLAPYSPDPDQRRQAVQLVVEAIDTLVDVITSRAGEPAEWSNT